MNGTQIVDKHMKITGRVIDAWELLANLIDNELDRRENMHKKQVDLAYRNGENSGYSRAQCRPGFGDMGG